MNVERSKKIRWGYLALGVVLLLCLGLIYAWSVFRAPLEAEFGWSKAQTSVTFSVSMTMFCLGGLASGMITGKKGPRFTLTACAFFLLAGFALASRIHSLAGIYITYGGFCGFGVGLGYNATISTLMRWFPDKQGLVSGITLMGFGFGGMLLGTLGAGLITALGWRTTFLIFAVAFAVIMLAGAALLRTAEDAFVEAVATGGRKKEAVEEIPWREMLRRRNFWLCFVWAVILSAAGLAIINEATTYAAPFVNGDLTRAAALAGMVSIANGVGRVISGQMFDTAGYRTTMLSISVVYIAASAALTASLKTGSVPILTAAFLLVGLAYGGVPPVNSAFVAYFFGRRHYALNFSIINLNLIAASYLGPLCGGGSYAGIFTAILIFAAAGAVLTLLVKRPVRT
ncbi:MFS transporter [uncultured Oscillibacter sp.]|jgi:OFA family oxalate/formate antiporter-like MFS transporter|uniref:MFS transporter n=1 Tax=uncultured Oscillibacter sp. TaxID=876091 RepID=UPI0025E3E547|nr:MFS transporter [uncultured Oscillibacter sp.]